MRTTESFGRGSSTPSRGRRRLGGICLALVLGGSGALPAVAGAADDPLAGGVGAAGLHAAGVTGLGVTVAVVGGPAAPAPEVLRAAAGHGRLLAAFDAVTGSALEPVARPAAGSGAPPPAAVLAAMLSSRRDPAGRFEGVAPDADLVLVRALGADGAGRAQDLARGIDWVVANRDRFGIRVLALPVAPPPGPRPGEEAVSEAALEAWRAGLVVVAAAGDGGPAPMTIAAPGEVPELITVGAAIRGPAGVLVAPYSAAGPIAAGFLKPELVAPVGTGEAAGTPTAAAVVAGVAALILQQEPWLTPDEVKRRLLASARPIGASGDGSDLLLRQGAGLVDAAAAAGFAPAPGSAPPSALRGITWSDLEARGPTGSDPMIHGLSWPGPAARGLTWSD